MSSGAQPRGHAPVELPTPEVGPGRKVLRRILFALALIGVVVLVAYVGRDGYEDADGSEVTLADAFYYATVSITTTGYGDITPVTREARLATTLIVTPARVLFLILLVGTTLEILAERTRTAYRLSRWRKRLSDHVIVCGYGTKGRSAIHTLRGKGIRDEQIVVIDERAETRAKATAAGLSAVAGSAASRDVLEEARVADADSVVVAVDRDDTAVLITLTARELAPQATIVAAVREEENVHLLHQSGADSVITSSGAAGRLLGLATDTPRISEVLEDLLTVGQGLDIVEREVKPEEVGPLASLVEEGPVVAVVREGELIRFDDERADEVHPGDRIVALCSHRR